METTYPNLIMDASEYLLYISKDVLTDLGMPEYIQILLNAEEHILAVRAPIGPKDVLGRIKVNLGAADNYLQIKGPHFFARISKYCPELQCKQIFSFSGYHVREHNLTIFDLRLGTRLEQEISRSQN